MTVEHQPVAAPRIRYLAALAVVSNGRPLDADRRAAFEAAMAEEGLPQTLRDALLIQAAAGVVPADVPAPELGKPLFVVALTRLALEVGGDRPDPLGVPEAVAVGCGLPRGLVARAAIRLGAEPATEAELLARLAAFFHPGPEVRLLALELAETLEPPRAPKRSFARVSPSRYQHPQDRAAIELLNGIAGFDDLTRLVFEHAFEKAFRVINLSSCVRVSERQFPELYRTYLEVVARVGVRPVPELYLKPGGINAHTSGVERPYVMLDAGAVGSLSPSELEFIIGHELGHVRCQHMLHSFVASVLPALVGVVPIAGRWIGMALEMAIADWRRKAEFSCDRVGLLACQDLEAAQRVMIKISGVPAKLFSEIDMAAYLEQNREFEGLDTDVMSLVFKLLAGSQSTHPWTVQRVAEMQRWVDSGEYAAILADGSDAPGDAPTFLPLPTLPAMAFRCAVCSTAFSLAARECPQCGAPPRDADRVRRCAACGDVCGTDATYCGACTDPAARRERLAPPKALEGPPAERLRDVLVRLQPAVAGLGLGALAGEPLAVLASVEGRTGHLTVIAGERGRGQQALAELLPDDLAVQVSPALDGPDVDVVAATLLPADLVLVALDARQLLSKQERDALRERVFGLAHGELALVVQHLAEAEEPEDRAALRERVRRFAERSGRPDLPVFFPGDPDDANATQSLLDFVAEAHNAGADRREKRWLGKSRALLSTLAGMLEAGGAAGGWREATAEERADMAHALRQEHALAKVHAEALLASRFAALRAGLAPRLAAMDAHALQHEGLGQLVAEVHGVSREVGQAYLDAFERGLMARAPQPLRRASDGFKPVASAHLARDMAGAEGEVVIEGKRDRNVMLMALTAVGAGLVIFGGGVALPVIGALSLAGAHGLRLDVDESHQARVREDAARVVEGWLAEAERALREQLEASAELVFEAMQARVETAMAAPIVEVTPSADAPHAVLALLRQGLALADEASQENA